MCASTASVLPAHSRGKGMRTHEGHQRVQVVGPPGCEPTQLCLTLGQRARNGAVSQRCVFEMRSSKQAPRSTAVERTWGSPGAGGAKAGASAMAASHALPCRLRRDAATRAASETRNATSYRAACRRTREVAASGRAVGRHDVGERLEYGVCNVFRNILRVKAPGARSIPSSTGRGASRAAWRQRTPRPLPPRRRRLQTEA